MANAIKHLSSQARSFVDAMAMLPKKELALPITGEYASEYNRLRGMVAEALANVQDHIPPVLNLEKGVQPGYVCQTRYVELLTYCRTLVRLLDSHTPTAIPHVVKV